MTSKIVFVADFFADQVQGGGELNNEEVISLLKDRGHTLEKVLSQNVTKDFLLKNKESNFIVANFIGLSEECKRDLYSKSYKYIIYEHDHKYLRTRDPSGFENHTAPKDQIINLPFYTNALGVMCQSKMHKEVVYKNLQIDNIHNLSGNLWGEDILDKLSTLNKKEKHNKYSIWDSYNPIKATSDTIRFCHSKSIPYELVGNLPYQDFLEKMSNNDTFIFLPKTLETLCRVIVEARMCGMKVVTNNQVGATSESWFSLKGDDLIEVMRKKREEIITKIEDVLL
jgi:hypothetical protein|tara:strand:+ start:959 stop:1807 length:849 start_codon:yes stop_codon:yes gene_type:complete